MRMFSLKAKGLVILCAILLVSLFSCSKSSQTEAQGVTEAEEAAQTVYEDIAEKDEDAPSVAAAKNAIPKEYEVRSTWYDGAKIIRDVNLKQYYLDEEAGKAYPIANLWYSYYFDEEKGISVPLEDYSKDNDYEGEVQFLVPYTEKFPNGRTMFGDTSYGTRLVVPKTVKNIDFASIGRINEVVIDPENEVYADIGGNYYDKKEKSLILMDPDKQGKSTTSRGGFSVSFGSTRVDCSIPDGILAIGAEAFTHDADFSLSVPDSLKKIDPMAFADGRPYSLILGENNKNFVTIDGVIYTADMKNLVFVNKGSATVVIPDTVESIYAKAFYGSNVKNVTLPSGLKNIYSGALYGVSVEALPESVELIGDEAFMKAAIAEELVIPGSVKVVGNGAFQECSMPSAVISEGVEEIGEKAFYLSSAKSVSLPETIKDISFAAFASMPSLEEMTLPETIETIGKRAFYKCPVLKKVVLPDGLISIADEAFYGCSALESANVPGSVEAFGSNVFYKCGNLSLSVDKSSAAYEEIVRQYSGNIAPDWL